MAKKLIGFDFNNVETMIAHTSGTTYYEQTPNNLASETGIVYPESLAQFFKNAKKKGKISGDNCAIVLPENTTYFRTIDSPILTNEQIKLNLPYEFRNFVGPDTVKYNYDYFVDSVNVDPNGKPVGLNLVAAAGLKEVIDEYERVCKKAGLKLKLALPKEIYLINFMKEVADDNKEYCLIGVGYLYTNVYMFKGSKLEAVKAIDIGNREIDRAIAAEAGIEEFLASNYRDSNHENCLAIKSLREIYEKIALEVVKTINFYKYEHNDSNIESAYFFDIGAKNDYLIKTICNNTELRKGNIKEILPNEFKNNRDADRCLFSIGLIL